MNRIIEPFIKPEGLNNTKQIKQINIGETEDNTDEKLEISKEKSTDILIDMYTLLDKKNKGNESDDDEDEDSLYEEETDTNNTVPGSTTNASTTNSSKVGRTMSSNIPSIPKSQTTPLNKPATASHNPSSGNNNPKTLNNSKYNSHPSSDSSR